MIAQAIVADKRGKKSVKVGKSLGAGRFPLQCIEKVNYLPQYRTEMFRD